MSSTHSSNHHTTQRWSVKGKYNQCDSCGHWSVANIAAMVLGFVIFAPLGIAILVWTLMGRPVQELPPWVREQWYRLSGSMRVTRDENDNGVFNDYQQTQYDRIREIKEEIRQRAEAFRIFRADVKRRQDQKEFDDFMASNPDDRTSQDKH